MTNPALTLDGVLETCLYVDDLERAEQFYRDVLRLRCYSKQDGRHVFFECGNSMLLLFDAQVSSQTREPPADPGLPPHGTSGPGHVAFAVELSQLPAWRGHLVDSGVDIEYELTWPGGGQSIYFRDPAGNSLEVASRNIWRRQGT